MWLSTNRFIFNKTKSMQLVIEWFQYWMHVFLSANYSEAPYTSACNDHSSAILGVTENSSFLSHIYLKGLIYFCSACDNLTSHGDWVQDSFRSCHHNSKKPAFHIISGSKNESLHKTKLLLKPYYFSFLNDGLPWLTFHSWKRTERCIPDIIWKTQFRL